ncbi:hypothetical protein GOP47_0024378 [Adiantum capillus-veneris]|uniref:Uncharacterized protein n=2 Tax=Adiantum capillus-veneris TaxID=13818 RepID=A0A9D4U2U8_ADICA|nr:hypothetical protein GOP47_0024378 [Adiantum capillus-veneris]
MLWRPYPPCDNGGGGDARRRRNLDGARRRSWLPQHSVALQPMQQVRDRVQPPQAYLKQWVLQPPQKLQRFLPLQCHPRQLQKIHQPAGRFQHKVRLQAFGFLLRSSEE